LNFKRFLWILHTCLILFIFTSSLFSQNIKSKTVIKAALESGAVNLHKHFGDGLLYRGILRVQSRINFPRSHLLVKGRFSKEFFDVPESIKSLNQQGNLSYVKYLRESFFQLNSSFNNHSSSIDSFGTQNINEWQIGGLFNMGISKSFNIIIRDTYFSRNFSISNIDYSKNRAQFSLSYNKSTNRIISAGLFWENLHLQDTDTTDSKELFGVQLEYQYTKLIILNLIYNYGFALNNDYNSQQLNLVIGKYLSKKWSMFVSLFYTWIMDDKNYLELYNRVQVFNNINLKLGYDLLENTNIYLKGILEDHKLVNYKEKITSRQFVLGLQQKF